LADVGAFADLLEGLTPVSLTASRPGFALGYEPAQTRATRRATPSFASAPGDHVRRTRL